MLLYDIVIIGAGPSGLALAHALSNLKLKILIIDKENTIGGCHRVKRVHNGIFTEHGPRIYLSNYLNLFNLMREMNLNVNDIFTEYKYSFYSVAVQKILPNFTYYDIFMYSFFYILYLFNSNFGKDVNLYHFLIKYGFSDEAINIIDRLCRYVDGGNAKRYSLNKLLSMQDANMIAKIYQPKQPLDISLFDKWKQYLMKRNVTFMLGKNVTYIHNKNNKIKYIILDDKKIIYLDKLILAIPPKAISNLLNLPMLHDCFADNFDEWAEKTEYIEYISITYHFKEKLHLPYINGLSLNTDWGIAVVNLSDYMTNIENHYSTVLSTAITICDQNSRFIYKTANECNRDELIAEVHRQIKRSVFHDIPDDYYAVLNPNNYYNVNENKWENTDEAYFNTFATKSLNYNCKTIHNLFNVGTHNGNSYMQYTTMDSAISNALVLAYTLYPQLKNKYYIRNFLTAKHLILFILLLLVIIIISFYSII